MFRDEIKRLRNSESEAREAVNKAHGDLEEARNKRVREVEIVIRDQEQVERQKLAEQAVRLSGQYNAQLSLQGQQISELNRELRKNEQELRAFYESKLDQKESEYSLEKEQLTAEYKKLENNKKQELCEIEKKHAAELNDFRQKTDNLLAEAENRTKDAIRQGEEEAARVKQESAPDNPNLETTVTALKAHHDQELERRVVESKAMLAELQMHNDKNLRDLAERHRHEVERIILNHGSDTRKLIDEVHALNKVLQTRDDEPYIPPMLQETGLAFAPDEYVRAKFSEVIQYVDNLSRLAWKVDQKVWTDEVLRAVGGTQSRKLLKKTILQNTIWTIVKRHVFCSPLRIFGKEGEILEKQWNERCGTDPDFDNGIYTWPPLSIENERWRYITLRECRKALVGPAPSQYDPRNRLNTEFKAARSTFVAELKGTLDEMVEWGVNEVSNVERLAHRLSNVWLELGIFRCRFVIFLRGSMVKGGVEEKVKLAMAKGPEGGLELNVVPGLRRHGNVKGVELMRTTVVGGLAGECVRLGEED